MLVLEVAALRLAAFAHDGVHPHLPRATATEAANPICIATYGENEVVLACGSAISLVHVF